MFVVADNDTNVDVANAGVVVATVDFSDAVVEVVAVGGYVLSQVLLNLS